MGHRDLLVTHNLSDDKHHDCRPHARGSVRRASGFVLTGKAEVMEDAALFLGHAYYVATLCGPPPRPDIRTWTCIDRQFLNRRRFGAMRGRIALLPVPAG